MVQIKILVYKYYLLYKYQINDLYDYPLSVALRWRHFEVIELLLINNPN